MSRISLAARRLDAAAQQDHQDSDENSDDGIGQLTTEVHGQQVDLQRLSPLSIHGSRLPPRLSPIPRPPTPLPPLLRTEQLRKQRQSSTSSGGPQQPSLPDLPAGTARQQVRLPARSLEVNSVEAALAELQMEPPGSINNTERELAAAVDAPSSKKAITEMALAMNPPAAADTSSTCPEARTQRPVSALAAGDDDGEVRQAVIQDGRTPLMRAVVNGSLVVVQQLLLKGNADVNKADKDDVTALMLAARSGKLELVDALLKAGADVNAADKDGQTALMKAARLGSREVVEALLHKEIKADVQAADKDGINSLLYAAVGGHVKVMKLLLEAGAPADPLVEIRESDIHPKGPKLGRDLHDSATQSGGGLVRYCEEAAYAPTGGIDRWLPPLVVLCFICRVMRASGSDLLCSKLLEELLPRSIAREWTMQGGREPFTRLVEALARHNPRLLSQLILGARTPLLVCNESQPGWGVCRLLTSDSVNDPLIAAPGSTTGRAFLPLAFIGSDDNDGSISEKRKAVADIPSKKLVELGRETIWNVVSEVANAVGACLEAGLPKRGVYGRSSTKGGGGGRWRAAWDTIDDALLSRRKCMMAHWFASAALTLTHWGPTGVLAAAIMAVGWLWLLALLQPLLLLLALASRVVLEPLRLLEAARSSAFPCCYGRVHPKLDSTDTNGNVGTRPCRAQESVGDVGDHSGGFYVSLREVRLPGAATLLSPDILARLLSDPRVDSRLWTSPAYQAIMELRWLRFTRHVVTGVFLIRVANLVVFVIYVLNLGDGAEAGSEPPPCQQPAGLQASCMVVLSFMTAEYAVAEARQLVRMGMLQWGSNPWNWFDIAQIGLMASTLGLHWSCAASLVVVRCLAAMLVLVMFWRLFGYATAVVDLASFVRMVLEVSLDLRWFFLFLGAIFCGFGVALTVLQTDIGAGDRRTEGSNGGTSSASRTFARLYSMMFGNFDAVLLMDLGDVEAGGSGGGLSTLTTVICSLFMLFVAVILLNLLIAIIGDAYDRVCKDGEMHLARSRAHLVVDTELLLPDWFIEARDKALLQCDSLLVIQPEQMANGDDEGGGDGGGANRSLTHSRAWCGRLRETQALLATTENLPMKSMLREQADRQAQMAKLQEKVAADIQSIKAQVDHKTEQQAAQLTRLEALVMELLQRGQPQAAPQLQPQQPETKPPPVEKPQPQLAGPLWLHGLNRNRKPAEMQFYKHFIFPAGEAERLSANITDCEALVATSPNCMAVNKAHSMPCTAPAKKIFLVHSTDHCTERPQQRQEDVIVLCVCRQWHAQNRYYAFLPSERGDGMMGEAVQLVAELL